MRKLPAFMMIILILSSCDYFRSHQETYAIDNIKYGMNDNQCRASGYQNVKTDTDSIYVDSISSKRIVYSMNIGEHSFLKDFTGNVHLFFNKQNELYGCHISGINLGNLDEESHKDVQKQLIAEWEEPVAYSSNPKAMFGFTFSEYYKKGDLYVIADYVRMPLLGSEPQWYLSIWTYNMDYDNPIQGITTKLDSLSKLSEDKKEKNKFSTKNLKIF